MPLIPQSCPSCSSPLIVTQLTCTSCGTGVVGKFELSPFHRLSPERLKFLEVFVRNRAQRQGRGATRPASLYWAIRRQLDEVITEMGMEPPKEDDISTRRQEILARLQPGRDQRAGSHQTTLSTQRETSHERTKRTLNGAGHARRREDHRRGGGAALQGDGRSEGRTGSCRT
ncbi:MAG: DUF2089 domain-containing protein [Candidatus Moduliflexus flocculans]|nr:DUF2089 domain-containing protein [Candidatus Moduliflexus flocculans]